MSTTEVWRGSFGDDYTARNKINWQDRYEAWYAMVHDLPIHSVLEVGCNRGHNLVAIERVIAASTKRRRIRAHGVDVNPQAVRERVHPGVLLGTMDIITGQFDLVFTAGVLIHIAAEDLDAFMGELVGLARHYVLAIEYHADRPTGVRYRKQADLLWKRPWRVEFERRFPRLVFERGGHWTKAEGFDRCGWWLWSKPWKT